MSIEDAYKRHDIEVFASQKHGPYIKLTDMIEGLLYSLTPESAADIAVTITESFELSKALAEMLKGDGQEQSSWSNSERSRNAGDKLRAMLLPHADAATLQFANNLIKENAQLRAEVEEGKKHIKALEAEWPESYKRYLPKQPFVYANAPYLSHSDVRKLIENFTSQSQVDEIAL